MVGLLRLAGWLLAPLRWLSGTLLRMSILPVLLLIVAAVAGSWTWWRFVPRSEPASIPATLAEAVRQVSEQVPPALPRPSRVLRPILVLPLEGDRELLVTGAIRDALARQGWYHPVDEGRLGQLIERIHKAAGVPQEPVSDSAAAVKLANAASAEVVIFGRVERLEILDDRAEVAFHLQALEAEGGASLLDRSFASAKPSQPGTDYGLRLGVLLGLAAFALIWPPMMIPLMRRVLKMESNGANLLAIVLITAVPVAVAWPVVFGAGAGWWAISGFVLAVLLTGFWSAAVMAWVAETEQ